MTEFRGSTTNTVKLLAMTAAVAIYAALVATAAFIWNVYTWRRGRSTRIAVRSYELPYYGPDHQQAGWAFHVLVTNQSGHDISIAEVAVKDKDMSRFSTLHMVTPGGAKLPTTVPQHHQVELGCDSCDLEAIDYSAMTIRVRLGDDRYHCSPPEDGTMHALPSFWPFRRLHR
jgi:hypothetical protein